MSSPSGREKQRAQNWINISPILVCTLVFCFQVDAGLSETEEINLRAARQGTVVLMPELLAQRAALPLVPVGIAPTPGPQFLFSDKPEYFLTGNGIALQEEVKPGVVRLYIYHVPTPTNAPKTISAVLENLGREPLSLRFLRRARPPPGTDYHRIAKTALIRFLDPEANETPRSLPPGSRAPLDSELDAATAVRDQLVHAFYEFEINQPARVTVFQRDPGQASVEVIDTLPKLPATLPGKSSGAGRGLFLTSELAVTNSPGFVLDSTNGAMQLIIADGRHDPWIRGRDAISGQESVNVGNYGTVYRIRLARASSDGRGLALFMCQVAGHSQWCGKLAAAVRVSEGVWPGGVVAIPSDRTVFGGTNEAVLIQKFPPLPRGKTGTIEILYSPPGACCLPTPLLLVPYQP